VVEVRFAGVVRKIIQARQKASLKASTVWMPRYWGGVLPELELGGGVLLAGGFAFGGVLEPGPEFGVVDPGAPFGFGDRGEVLGLGVVPGEVEFGGGLVAPGG
jgi:hypothetical protein